MFRRECSCVIMRSVYLCNYMSVSAASRHMRAGMSCVACAGLHMNAFTQHECKNMCREACVCRACMLYSHATIPVLQSFTFC